VCVRNARQAIWHGLDIYLELFADFDKRLRIVVPYTLGFLVRYATDEMPEGIQSRKTSRTDCTASGTTARRRA
jgi:hypothetical protein